jgi:AhpD family alkylhydroperoxidase
VQLLQLRFGDQEHEVGSAARHIFLRFSFFNSGLGGRGSFCNGDLNGVSTMSKQELKHDYLRVAQDVVEGATALRSAIPNAMAGFGALGAAAYADGALSGKHKELIALAIGITVRCDGCVGYHAKACFDKGASREEVAEAIAVAVQMGGGPSMVYGATALDAYDQISAAEKVELAFRGQPRYED